MRIERYTGIPFKDHGRGHDGCDCWGLVRLVYAEELGIWMPDLGDRYGDAHARGDVDFTVDSAAAEAWSVNVTDRPRRELDVLVFSRGGLETHVGLHVRGCEMLHVMDGMCAAVERYDTAKWRRRFSRALRHREAL